MSMDKCSKCGVVYDTDAEFLSENGKPICDNCYDPVEVLPENNLMKAEIGMLLVFLVVMILTFIR